MSALIAFTVEHVCGLPLEKDAAHGRDLVAMTVAGDCMEPEIQTGYVVLVDPT